MIRRYFEEVQRLLSQVLDTQAAAMEAAATAVAAALQNGGTVFTFGTGHSHMLAEEVFYRAGGLVKVYPLLDEPLMLHVNASRSSRMERLTGYAETLLQDGPVIREGDVLFIFSNSGRNAVPVDMAVAAHARGMRVVCITNLAHSQQQSSRHPSGKKLFEVSDIVIDNGGAVGDAALDVGGTACGPTSTVVGAAVMQAVTCRAVELLQSRGATPEVFCSSNIDGGDAVNAAYIDKYKSVIHML